MNTTANHFGQALLEAAAWIMVARLEYVDQISKDLHNMARGGWSFELGSAWVGGDQVIGYDSNAPAEAQETDGKES